MATERRCKIRACSQLQHCIQKGEGPRLPEIAAVMDRLVAVELQLLCLHHRRVPQPDHRRRVDDQVIGSVEDRVGARKQALQLEIVADALCRQTRNDGDARVDERATAAERERATGDLHETARDGQHGHRRRRRVAHGADGAREVAQEIER